MIYDPVFSTTPLDPSEKKLLIPRDIQTMEELNAFEHNNIMQAEMWALTSKVEVSIPYIKKLHKKMFDRTWLWAGKFRKTEKNIGIHAYRVQEELGYLCQDIIFQISNASYPLDEIAARFHHRLVPIHPFPNGNGRHARLLVDLLLLKHGHSRFSWGSMKQRNQSDSIRKEYIEALKAADQHDLSKLLAFVRA